MKPFSEFPLNESTAPAPLSKAQFPTLAKDKGKYLDRAIPVINTGIENNEIQNAVYNDLKRDVNYALEGISVYVRYAENDEVNVNGTLYPRKTFSADTFYSLYAHQVEGALKKATAAQKKAPAGSADRAYYDAIVPQLQEALPLAKALLFLKDKAVKRTVKEPETAETRRAKYVAPLASSEAGALIVKSLEGISEGLKPAYEQEVFEWISGVVTRFAALDIDAQNDRRGGRTAKLFMKMFNITKPNAEFGARSPKGELLRHMNVYTLKSGWEAEARKEAKEQADIMQQEFVIKNSMKLKSIVDTKGVGLTQAPIGRNLRVGGRGLVGEMDFIFTDGSKFTVRNKVVYKVSTLGKGFAQFPTTFHNAVLPDGTKMPEPNERTINDVFAKAR